MVISAAAEWEWLPAAMPGVIPPRRRSRINSKEKTLFIVMDPSPLFAFLDEHGIAYQRCDHPAVFTVDEATRRVPPLPGAKTKNLFLRDKPGRRHFLVCAPAAKSVDMRALSDAIGAGRLSFGSPERLKRFLGVEPGAVTLFAVFNDPAGEVQLLVDEELWQADAFQFHPLVNTITLVIAREAVERFLQLTGHSLRRVKVEGRGVTSDE
jgi:Ala-tRNA(Pro) deacylase